MERCEKPSGFIRNIPHEGMLEYKPHRINTLRDDFNQHVIGPLSQVAISRTLDTFGNEFLRSLRGNLGRTIKQETTHDPLLNREGYAVIAIEKITRELEKRAAIHITQHDDQPIRDLLSPRQHTTAVRFGTARMEGWGLDAGLFAEIGTVADIVTVIARRHPELDLGNTQTLAAFLRNPNTHRIFRGFGRGGNAFIGGFRFNSHPVTLPWGSDGEKPVLDTSRPVPQINRDVLEAATESREINEELLKNKPSPKRATILGDFGLFKSSKRISSGCPARHTVFKIDVASLVTNELSLSSDQVNTLVSLTTPPVIQQFNPTTYLIVRDSYAEACNFFARALEIIQPKPAKRTRK